MTPSASLKCVLAIVLMMLATSGRFALAVDGYAIAVHYEAPEGTWGNIHAGGPDAPGGKYPGKLMRYDVKDDRCVGKKVLYDKTDLGDVRMSPFGDRIAFVRPDGMILLVPADGGETTEVGPVADANVKAPIDTQLYWPSSDGARWIYYHDRRVKENVLRRVNVDTKKDEFVVKFNNYGGGDMTPNATPNSGYIVVRTDNYHCRVYNFAKGDGDLQHSPDYIPGCGLSCSPDSQLWAANNGTHTEVHLMDMNAQIRTGWRISEWNGDPTKGITERAKIGWAWQNFRWTANAMNLLSVQQGPLNPGSDHIVSAIDVMVYDWSNRKQFNVTNNPPAHFDRAGGFWQVGGKEGYLGSYQNKAPLTVEIADKRLTGDAIWDFGDGGTAKGSSAKHVYSKQGNYLIVAKQGDMTYKAQVNVLPPKAPRATAIVVNSKCVMLAFDEPVKADTAQLAFASGAKPEASVLNDTGTQMVVYLADDLKASDKLTIKGITDLAQVPNAMDATPINIEVRAWPANREKLSFVWEDATTLNAVLDQPGKSVRMCEPIRDRDVAGFGRYGRMYCGLMGLDGSVITGYYANIQGADIIKAGEFTMECVFQPTMAKQPKHMLEKAGGESPFPARILQCGSWSDDNWMFLIGQREDKLQISLRTSENMTDENGNPIKSGLSGKSPIFDIATLTDTKPHHIAVTYSPGKLSAYLDGKRVFENTNVRGNLSNWNYGELSFGDCHNGGRHGWFGNIEGVALYARAIDAAEAARNSEYFAKKIAARTYPPRMQVEAKVLAVTQTPDPQRILPYQEALVVNEYEVVRVLGSDKNWKFQPSVVPGAKIRVAQWGLVPARFQSKKTWVADLKPSEVRTLELEAFEGNMDKLDSVVTNDDLEITATPLLYQPRE